MNNPPEQWRPVADPAYAEAYHVSNRGNVLSVRRGRLLRPGAQSRGYLNVVMQVGLRKKTITVHRLVARAWLDAPLAWQTQINHRDGNKRNNSVENLEWVSQSENMRHSYLNGMHKPSRK